MKLWIPILMAAMWFGPAHAKKNVQALGLEPGLYSAVSKVYVNGKLVDPLSKTKKEIVAMENQRDKKKAVQAVREYDSTKICITKQMLTPQNFYKGMPDSTHCKYKVKRAQAKQLTAEFDCGSPRGAGIVTTKAVTSKTYESAFINNKNAKGELVKVITAGKWVAAQCPSGVKASSGKVVSQIPSAKNFEKGKTKKKSKP